MQRQCKPNAIKLALIAEVQPVLCKNTASKTAVKRRKIKGFDRFLPSKSEENRRFLSDRKQKGLTHKPLRDC